MSYTKKPTTWLTNNRIIGETAPYFNSNNDPIGSVDLYDDPILLEGEGFCPKIGNYWVVDSDNDCVSESDDDDEEDCPMEDNFETDCRIAKNAAKQGAHCLECLGDIDPSNTFFYFGYLYCSKRCVLNKILYA